MGRGFRVSGVNTDGDAWKRDCERVVNALWQNRLAMDAKLGLKPASLAVDFVVNYHRNIVKPANIIRPIQIVPAKQRNADVLILFWYKSCQKTVAITLIVLF